MFVSYDEKYGITALANLFELPAGTVFRIVHGERYKTANGIFHAKKAQRPHVCLSKEIRQEIRHVHKPHDPQFGTKPLALKYKVDRSTISKILRETSE